jgi:hypothetical protein
MDDFSDGARDLIAKQGKRTLQEALDGGDRHGEDLGNVLGQHVFLMAQVRTSRGFPVAGDELLESSGDRKDPSPVG